MSAVLDLPVEPSVAEQRKAVRVLSTAAGPFPVQDELREKVCLLENGELLILKSAAIDPDVLAYRDTLTRSKHRFTLAYVPLAELHDLYTRALSGGAEAEKVSNRQNQVLQIIDRGVKAGATDIHFRVGKKVCSIWQRVHGDFELVTEVPAQEGHELCATIYGSMCDVAEPTFNADKSQDGRLKEEFVEGFKLWGARVSTRPRDRGVVMVLRLLSGGNKDRRLEDLGYLPEQAAIITRLTKMKSGINIFSGPTGSGKSTSQQVLIGKILKDHDYRINVITIEDPPEYPIEGSVQTPLGQSDWEAGIRNLMRLDPDIVMIGEMRDLVSVQGAFRAALTGHGVWTTLHANDATAILQRLDDIGLDQGLALDPAILTGLINQNLAPTLCPKCKVTWDSAKARLAPDLVERVEYHCDPAGIFVRGPGCGACHRRGINGRTVIAEVISPNLDFMRVYKQKGKAESRLHWIQKMGGISKIHHLIRRINEGLIDPADGEHAVGLLDSEITE